MLSIIGRYKLLLVDIDGVVWRGSRVLEENIVFLRRAHEAGAKLIFMTNNATRTRQAYAGKLSRILGFTIEAGNVYTSGYATAVWLREVHGSSRVLVVGEEGLVEELAGQGHVIVNAMDEQLCPVDFVVVGLDRNATYAKLARAHYAVTVCGARLVASNADNAMPTATGFEPGAGALVAFLEASTNTKAVVIGKPNTYMAELALKTTGIDKSQALVVGDRCDSDVELARRAGLDSVLVLTGVAREGECNATYTVKTLAELV